jgi:radical SAM superfamily enzyme YgiQ (UPF0313 family)
MINPPIRLSDKPRHIPHGLAILANIIREKIGIPPEFLDINAHRYPEDEVRRILQKTDFDIVLTGGLIPVYKNIIGISAMLRDSNPDVTIIAGGSAAMSVPDLLLTHSEVDIICRGEGEVTVVELLRHLLEKTPGTLGDIPGISYKSGRIRNEIVSTPDRPLIKDLDTESILPAYDLLPMDIYLSNPVVGMGKDIDFISSRGCPYSCSFCYQPWGRKFRGHSVDFIIRSLLFLKENYAIDFVSFQDDEFMANKARVYEFCEKKQQVLPDLLWSCTGRANIIAADEKVVPVMKKAGCVLISYGFESGSQRILDSMNKKITIRQMEETIRISRKNNLPIPASFIIGMPGEDADSCKETLDFCLRNNLPLDSLMFATPYPGTRIFDFAIKTGRIDPARLHEFVLKLGDARDFLINLTDSFSDAELIETRSRMMTQAKENYSSFITQDEIDRKVRNLFGDLIRRTALDESELDHRAKHGGINTF